MGKNKMKPGPVAKDPVPEPELVSEFSGQPQEGKAREGGEADPGRAVRHRARQAKVRSVLDGTFVLDKGIRKYWSLILYVFLLGFLLITNNYLSERVLRECSEIKKELKELRYRQISAKAEWMRLSRQSSVARMLDSTGVKESVVPPFKVASPEPEGRKWWQKK